MRLLCHSRNLVPTSNTNIKQEGHSGLGTCCLLRSAPCFLKYIETDHVYSLLATHTHISLHLHIWTASCLLLAQEIFLDLKREQRDTKQRCLDHHAVERSLVQRSDAFFLDDLAPTVQETRVTPIVWTRHSTYHQ